MLYSPFIHEGEPKNSICTTGPHYPSTCPIIVVWIISGLLTKGGPMRFPFLGSGNWIKNFSVFWPNV